MVLIEQLQGLKQKGKTQLQVLGIKAQEVTQFIRENPIVSGAAVGGSVLAGGLLIAQQIKKRRKKVPKERRKRGSRLKVPRGRIRRVHRHLHKPRRHTVRAVHKHRRKGLDIAHRGKKRGISLKAIRASIASPKTPEPLKRGLRKFLKKHGR